MVSMEPGFTSVTEMPASSCSNSMRSASVKPLMACLEAEYIPCRGMAVSETSLPRLIMAPPRPRIRSEEHTSELQSRENLVCRLLLEKKKKDETRSIRNSQ